MHFNVETEGIRLDKYIRKFINPIKQSTIEISLRSKAIMLNKKSASSSDRLKAGDVVYVSTSLLNGNAKATQDKKIKQFISSLIIYEDSNVMIINKPYGLAVQGGKKLHTSVDDLVGNEHYIVHRLDQHTTGALIIAKNLETTKVIGEKFKNKEVIKKYFALTSGIPSKSNGKIVSNIVKKYINGQEIMVSSQNNNEGKQAITEFRVIERFHKHSIAYVELLPLTGRKHQLRVHMNDLKCPILSDGKYGGKPSFIEGFRTKLNLHAHYISFDLYGKKIEANASIPDHVSANLKLLSQ